MVVREGEGECERCNRRVRIDTDALLGGLWDYNGKWYDYYCYQIVVGIFPPAKKHDDPTPLTTQQAADALNLDHRTILQYIRRGLIEATKFGRDWQIDPAEIERYQRKRRKPGRPPKHN